MTLSPSLSCRKRKRNGLQLPNVQAVRQNRAINSCRRSIETTGTTAAGRDNTAAEEEEEKELRLLTWMEVEARIERDIAEVRSGISAALFRRLLLTLFAFDLG